jgi:hypothetical protein
VNFLGLALYAEGPTDYRFLCPLLRRLCEDICLREASGIVEISEVLALDHPSSAKEQRREDRILAAAQAASGSWNILFLHSDGSGDAERARMTQVEPALAKIAKEFGDRGFGVAVVPVRETEAWAIADGDTLRKVWSSVLADKELGLPNSALEVARTADPKATLKKAYEVTHPHGRRKLSGGASAYLSELGEQVPLDKLRNLIAFARLESDLLAALRQLRILRQKAAAPKAKL